MNIAEKPHSELSLKLVSAIQDPQKWGEVLDQIMEMTGAKAALITLRDKETCQIVNDHNLEQKFHSPLIRGFSHEAIVHYLTNLRTIDPWAEFQRTHYPFRPMQMSKFCPVDSIAETQFFDWLSDLGFQDTVVFELERMAGYWTAMNLFLENQSGSQADGVVAFANANYDLLRQSWQASQGFARSKQTTNALLSQASSGGAPVCVAGPNGELIDCNALFQELIDFDAIRLSGNSRKLSFARSISVHGLDRWEQHEFLAHNADVEPFLLLAKPVDPDPLFADKREQMWLLTCSNFGKSKVAPGIIASFNLDALSPQERKLYKAVASGKSVSDAGEAVGLRRSRAFEVWSSVKEKLDISTAHQLRK